MGSARRAKVCTVIAAVLVVTACGGDDGSTSADVTDGSAPSSGEIVEHDPTQWLNVLGANAPQHVDPVRSIITCEVAQLQPLYDTLVRVDPDGSLVPGLATSWSAPDPLTFELELRTDVTFQDGTPFDASAVKAHLERALSDPESVLVGELSAIDSVEAVGPTTVRIRLNEPRAGVLPFIFTGRAGMVPSPAAVTAAGEGGYGVTSGVGAGPYQFVSLLPTQDLKLERWDGYFEPDRQLLEGIEFKGRAGELQTERMRAGEINYVGLRDADLPAAEAAKAQGVMEYQLSPSTQFAQVFLNYAAEPWSDLRVRQALNHALDREALTRVLSSGAGTVAWSPLPVDSWAHDPAVEDMYPYDPAKARQLLADAGYPDGLDVEVAFISRDYYQRMAEAVQDMVTASGFNFELVPVDPSEINNALYTRNQYDAAITANLASADPGLFLEAKYGSAGNQNPAATPVANIDELLATGAGALTQDERAAAYKEVERLVMENAIEVPIFHNGALTGFAPNVRNVTRGYTSCDLGNLINPPVYVARD